MLEPRFNRLVVILLVALSGLIIRGCIVVKDSPAPGCIKRIGAAPIGGCFGKTAILDLVVEPENACLSIGVNNCNGGVLEIRNVCQTALVLGAIRIAPQNNVSLDVFSEGNQHTVREISSNFSEYVPAVDEKIKLVGMLDQKPIRVTFTKTARLCE